jgi:hypothetical protein
MVAGERSSAPAANCLTTSALTALFLELAPRYSERLCLVFLRAAMENVAGTFGLREQGGDVSGGVGFRGYE